MGMQRQRGKNELLHSTEKWSTEQHTELYLKGKREEKPEVRFLKN